MADAFKFHKSQRLQRKRDFDRVFQARCSAADERLVIYVDGNGLPRSRLGLSVGRRVGGAVVRHRVKRLIREAFRLSQNELPKGFDIICVAKPVAPGSLVDYGKSLKRLIESAASRHARRNRTAGANAPAGGPTG